LGVFSAATAMTAERARAVRPVVMVWYFMVV
jgi:hypothetical protein